MNQFFGKYRAIVVNNKDPEFMGRIKVRCPKVLGEYASAWCTPCVPLAFNDGGLLYVPTVNETVWVEFEEGNPSKPIWTGSWWIPRRTPIGQSNAVEDKIILLSRKQHRIELDDKNNTITISNIDGSKIKLGNGILIESNSAIKINGSLNVTGSVTSTGSITTNNSLTVKGSISEGGTSLSSKYESK